MGLSDGVHFTILLSLCLAQYRRVTDGRPDGQTDGRTRRCRKDPRWHSVARVKTRNRTNNQINKIKINVCTVRNCCKTNELYAVEIRYTPGFVFRVRNVTKQGNQPDAGRELSCCSGALSEQVLAPPPTPTPKIKWSGQQRADVSLNPGLPRYLGMAPLSSAADALPPTTSVTADFEVRTHFLANYKLSFFDEC